MAVNFGNWDWDNIFKAVGAAGDLWSTYKGAEWAKDMSLTPLEQVALMQQMQPNYVTDFGSSLYDKETNTRTSTMAPGIKNLVNSGLAQMFGPDYQVSNGLLGPNSLSQASINEQRGYYGLPGVAQRPQQMGRPVGGGDYLLGETNGASGIAPGTNPTSPQYIGEPDGGPPQPQYGPGNSAVDFMRGGGVRGGGVRGGGAGAGGGAGYIGGGVTGGLSGGSALPGWIQGQRQGTPGRLAMGDFAGEYGGWIGAGLGELFGIPFGKQIGNWAGDKIQGNMYNNYRFDNPVDPAVGRTDVMNEITNNLDSDWQRLAAQNSSQGFRENPRSVGTGQDIYAARNKPGGDRMSGHNTVIFQNAKDGRPAGNGGYIQPWEPPPVTPWENQR